MKKVHDRPLLTLLVLGSALAAACGGGSKSPGSSSSFSIVEASNGFGRMLPHQIAVRDAEGNPTASIIEITRLQDLVDNVTPSNPILAPTEWPQSAILPDNSPGNHFIYARFSQPVEALSVLAGAISVNGGLGGSITLTVVDSSGNQVAVRGRAFVGGRSFGPTVDPDDTSSFLLQQWVRLNSDGDIEALIPEAVGFPGTEGGFAGDDVLVDPRTVVFVVDSDQDLGAPYETFPIGSQVQMRINGTVRSTFGRSLQAIGLATSTVGPDTRSPEIVDSDSLDPAIIPRNFAIEVDPRTNIELTFTEPIQILTVGELDDGTPPVLSAAVLIEFGPLASRVTVPFSVRPFSVYDLSRFQLVPAYNFPGKGPDLPGLECAEFNAVDVNVLANQFTDLNGRSNTSSASVRFFTREGPGLVNAPVMPDVIYVGRTGATPGISVIDLYGFGGGTGSPEYDDDLKIKEGNTNFPNNPNVAGQGSALTPPLARGNCTINGGSEGVFTLTKDSSLNDLLARSPLLESVGDMALGHPLDTTFNNSAPFGCQAGGGNLCAATGLKFVQLASGGPNSLAPSSSSTAPTKVIQGFENLMLFSPHPNPPPLSFPPLCLSPLLNGLEPTSIVTSTALVPNLLTPGSNPRGNPALNRPPSSLLASNQHSFFDGPSPAQPLISSCLQYRTRQQIGHFLYVVDRAAGEVVVFNSNRFTIVDRISTPDPTSLSMSPNLDILAVTNESADQVSFIDTKPTSSTFHQIVRAVAVGRGPTGIAWETGNEDIFVCNQGEGSVTILSAFTLRPRKVIRNQITRPIDVAITPRQLGFGFLRGVYFGYILNQDGSVAFFESGPDGLNGWGFDDAVGTLPFRFNRPKAIQPDISRVNSAVWIAHEDPLNPQGEPNGRTGGAITNVGISGATQGIIPIASNGFLNPAIRNMEFGVFTSIGEGATGLSGVPTDMAFDNMTNVTALNNFSTQFSAGEALSYNGRSLVRLSGGLFGSSSFPQFMFLAVPNPGVVDVFDLSTGTLQRVDANVFQPGIQSISAPNVSIVVDYMRQ